MSYYESLMKLYDEIDKKVTSDDSSFKTWHAKVEITLEKAFGKKSKILNDFEDTLFVPIIYTFNSTLQDFIDSCADGLKSTKAVFKAYLEELKENEERNDNMQNQIKNNNTQLNFSKIFIVHGHDDGLVQKVARMIERQKIKPIILNEQANLGRTIIEKLEGYSNVGGAICLFTPDDEGHEKGSSQIENRARQNVVFEAGYFMGKLGRKSVVVLSNKETTLPSDMSGIVYTNSESWESDLLIELKEIGYNINFDLHYMR